MYSHILQAQKSKKHRLSKCLSISQSNWFILVYVHQTEDHHSVLISLLMRYWADFEQAENSAKSG